MTIVMLAATALSTQEVISSMVVTIGQGCRILAQTCGHGSSPGLKYLLYILLSASVISLMARMLIS
jgi:hypothetical protein